MFKMDPTLSPDSSLPPEEKLKNLVLLSDSDGTIFCGNMSNVISAVITFLKKDPKNREDIEELFTGMGRDLPPESQPLLKNWLEQQELIPWTKPPEELKGLQQTIAGFFPLVKSQRTGTRKAKTPHTALDVFKGVWQRRGRVMILTFNRFAPHTIRYALTRHGLTEEEAQQIFIIYPGHPDKHTLPHEKIYACEPPDDGDMINKNGFIREAQRICLARLKLTQCQFIFMDDQHAQAAKLKFLGENVVAITGDYASGQHLKAVISLINSQPKGQRPRQISDLEPSPVFHHIPSQPPLASKIPTSSRKRRLNINSHFFPSAVITLRDMDQDPISDSEILDKKEIDTSPDTALSESQRPLRKGSSRQEELEPDLNPMSSLTELDHRTVTEILDATDELSLMFPQSLEKMFEVAYSRAITLEQKTRVIVKAIEYLYPQILENQVNSADEKLHQWIKKLDELFIAHGQNPQAQLQCTKAAQKCWSALQFSNNLSRVSGKEKLNQTSTDIREINFHSLFPRISKSDKDSFTTSPLSIHSAAAELQKWNQRQLIVDSRIADLARSCCCLIL